MRAIRKSVLRDRAAAEEAPASLEDEAARTHFRTVLGVGPEYPAALYGMGFVRTMGYSQFEEGLRPMEEVGGLAPHNERIVRNLSKARAMLANDGKVTSG